MPQSLSVYERLQLAGLSFVAGRVTRQNGRTLRNYREPISGISLFRIESGYPADALVRLNRALERQQWLEVSAWFGCPGFRGQEPGMDRSKAGTPWMSDDYVNFAWAASWSCANSAHPDFGTEGHTYDARSGRELVLEDILSFGDAAPPLADTDAFYAYRDKVFAPAVAGLLRRLYPTMTLSSAANNSGPEAISDDKCDYGEPEVWSFPSWHLTEKGLYLGTTFPRVIRLCDDPDWSVIPWSELRGLPRPGRPDQQKPL